MKKRVSIRIETELLRDARRYAARNNISLSQLTEGSLKRLTTMTSACKNVLELLSELPEPRKVTGVTTVENYCEDNKGKYGF